MRPVIAIVGRPNVGKSTLFNRLIGRRSALVDPTPGVTRDRREGDARLGRLRFTAVDTAGLEETLGSDVESEMQAQTLRAIDEADAVLLLFDARAGITPLDRHFADLMRKSRSPVILVANKCEARSADAGVSRRMNWGWVNRLQSRQSTGSGCLISKMRSSKPLKSQAGNANRNRVRPALNRRRKTKSDPDGPLQLAIVGRPNVGKSTLVNALVGDERVITGPQPGITRDAISIEWTWNDLPIKLIDTAGMRRKARVNEKVEKLSVGDTLEAIRFAHVVVLVLDATMMPEKQDLVIARHIIDEGRAIVIAVNKWDAVENRQEALDLLYDRMEISLPQIRGCRS